jgi:hypothetical protein
MLKTGKEPVLLYPSQQFVHTAESLANGMHNFDIDGFQCLGISSPFMLKINPIKTEPYETTLSRWQSFMDIQKNFFHIPCTNSGSDNRPWWRIEWYNATCDTDDNCIYLTGVSPEKFESHLRDVKNYLNQNPENTSKMLTIYAWNEWGEGSQIEPSVAYTNEINKNDPYLYLRILAEELGKTWVTPSLPPAKNIESLRRKVFYPQLAADLNNDVVVDIFDLMIVTTHFGQTQTNPSWNTTADVVANSEIDIYDVVFVASRFT